MDDAAPGVPDVDDDGEPVGPAPDESDGPDTPPGHDEERRYRVLEDPRGDGWLFAAGGEAAAVARAGAGEGDGLDDLEPGHRVRARLDWTERPPRVASLSVLDRTRVRFAADADPLFEAGVACWEAARAAGEPASSDLLRDSGGDVVGVVYAFADADGELFGEFRDGRRPLDPLLDRIEGADPPYEAFVLDPREYPCVVVAIALDPGSLFASTMRSTYA